MSARRFFCAALALLWAPLALAAEPDFAREQRLADEIVDVILDGDPEWLEANGREFLSIYYEADESKAAVIILHGRGFHPDWADAVGPLRVGLVDQGYTTLSLQMPVLAKDARYYDYIPIFHYAHERIDAGVRFLREQGHDRVVLLAHSCGAHMAMDWVRSKPDTRIDAYIGLGMGATDYGQPMHQPFPLDWMSVPILDLYAGNDYPAVKRLAPSRKQMMEKAGNALSRQIELPGSDHYYTDQGDPLVAAVADWLDQLD